MDAEEFNKGWASRLSSSDEKDLSVSDHFKYGWERADKLFKDGYMGVKEPLFYQEAEAWKKGRHLALSEIYILGVHLKLTGQELPKDSTVWTVKGYTEIAKEFLPFLGSEKEYRTYMGYKLFLKSDHPFFIDEELKCSEDYKIGVIKARREYTAGEACYGLLSPPGFPCRKCPSDASEAFKAGYYKDELFF